MEQFDVTDLAEELSSEARAAMLDLILAWAHLDGALSMWVAVKFGVSFDKLALLLPRQDGASKLLKLAKLYALEGNAGMEEKAREFRKAYEREVQPRNTVAHSNCIGSLKSNPQRIVFQTFAPAGAGCLMVETIPLLQMNDSIAWAHTLATTIEGILEEGAAAARLHGERK
jgi:hypothetical protein